jgi:hypothetical protein
MRVLILLIVATAGCVSPSPAPVRSASGGAAAGDSLLGTLRVVGSAPMNVRLTLQTATGSTTVSGPLGDELRRLAGAEVVLRGRSNGTDFVATDYRIRSVDGRPVTMGTVLSASGPYLQLRTAEGEIVYLVSPPPQIQPGQKVWVQGPRGVIVQSYGTVKP